jgi:hypothetical protein
MAKRDKSPHHQYTGTQGVKPARLMSIFNDLPRNWKFEFDPYFGIHLPGLHVSTEVSLRGHGTFLIEQTEDPAIVKLSVTDILFTLRPFILPFDIDGDGTYESVEIGSARIGSECLDKKKCKGFINLATGDIKIHWALNIKPGPGLLPELVPLMKKVDKKTFKFEVDDYGVVNFDDGSFEFHGGFFTLDESVFPGIMIRGSGPGKLCGNNWIWFYGSITPPAKKCQGYPLPDYTKELLVCPDDYVLFCWESGVVEDIRLNPGNFQVLTGSGNILEVPGQAKGSKYGQVDYIMTAKYASCSGTVNTLSDYVIVTIYDGGWLPGGKKAYKAKPDTKIMAWSCRFNENYFSRNIMVDTIRFVAGEDCLDWDSFHVDHIPEHNLPGNIGDLSCDVDGHDAVQLPFSINLSGQWNIYPLPVRARNPPRTPNPKDDKKQICFQLKGTCGKR